MKALGDDPEVWQHPEIIRTHNCYAYAMNDAVPLKGRRHFAQPANGLFHGAAKCIEAATRDGAKLAQSDHEKLHGHYRIALSCTEPFNVNEWHWYRDHQDGSWSHKFGDEPVSSLDHSGKVISDLVSATLRPGHKLLAFFHVPSPGLAVGRNRDKKQTLYFKPKESYSIFRMP